ncbi:MAG TPA: hypothetical protein PL100_05560 [Bacillota bacterium]|jgi:hypothetical protein|nr:hypothetical protein [Bacillota bacterium]HQC48972.1 hypothetical protein [Bacillota bacterium]
MAYRALEQMKKNNLDRYGLSGTVLIPPLPQCRRSYGQDALSFLRDCCEDLKFDPARHELNDFDGRSSNLDQIPFNMERDLDRLSFERAIGRFLDSGSREDAFDIYYCYCEIFEPFGAGYDATGILLEMLSEHEYNASSLLMKHRDHYSHSVYVFCIGLSIYKNHRIFREAYNARFGLEEGSEAACHFLEYWGMTSLFHDIGYPFEIAHQQMKAYVCKLDKNNNDDRGFAPYVSYKRMDEFSMSRLGDLNDFYAHAITERLAEKYLPRTETEPYLCLHKLEKTLKDRAVHENPAEKDYLYMDHAYFSGLVLAKTYLNRHREIESLEQIPVAVLDAFCAIILHNSLFKFTMRGFLYTDEPLRLNDGQPLAYLLMLCDELQCWDRASYGQNTRSDIYAFDFDMVFPSNDRVTWTYYYDKAYEDRALGSKAYRNMLTDGYTKKSGAVREHRSKFLDDIDEIVALRDIIPAFESNVKKPDFSDAITVSSVEKAKRTGLYLSDSNYLNFYHFALSLHARYCGAETPEEMVRAFEEDLSLEYKLSNIAQAKGFAAVLEKINCFYTDRAVDYEAVTRFTPADMEVIAEAEHRRWCDEKRDMGWQFGTDHVGKLPNGKNDNVMRECTRMHHDMVPFEKLPEAEKSKDSVPMEKMLELIRWYDGLTIYRM